MRGDQRTCWIDWQNSWSQVSKTVDSSESLDIIESSLTWSLRFTFALHEEVQNEEHEELSNTFEELPVIDPSCFPY
jgi:hypothetical protein